MEFKPKILKLSAGVPIAIINKTTAKELGIHPNERVLIQNPKSKKDFATIVNVVTDMVHKKEIGISSELKKSLQITDSSKLKVILAPTPISINFIKKKLSGKTLSKKEIYQIIKDIVENELSEPEIALFVSAMQQKAMNKKETIYLINAIRDTGEALNLKNKIIVDKHSIGGVAGNRTTPIVVSICTAAGLVMPKTSSRAITSAAGTADVIEIIAKVDFSMNELKKIIKKANACLVWGGGLGMVPADSKIIKVEKLLKIDPKAQLLASIIAKKLAVGSTHILIDIPYGKSAKVTKQKALELKKDFLSLAKFFKKKMIVLLTPGNEPIGKGVGPALEIRDVIRILDPTKQGPGDLEKKSLLLAGAIFEVTKKTKKGKGVFLAQEILYSGKAFDKFKQIIKAQGGKVKEPKLGKFKKEILSIKSGKIKEINNKAINSLARIAGSPEDKGAGLDLFIKTGEKIKKRDKLLTIYAESKQRLKAALYFYKKNKPITFK